MSLQYLYLSRKKCSTDDLTEGNTNNHTTAILQDCAECVLINLKNVPKPNYVTVHQCFMNIVFPDRMPYIALLLLFTPLSIQAM